MNLYDIADNIRQLAELSDEMDEQTLADTLEMLEGDLTEKADNIGKLVKMLTRQAEECNLEAIRLKDRAAQLQARAESVKDYLQACMVVAGQRKVENSLFNIAIRKIPDVIELDEELLPNKWFVEKVTMRPDRSGIKKAIENGHEIRGAKLVTDREKLYIR